MEVKIGIQSIPRELVILRPKVSAEEVERHWPRPWPTGGLLILPDDKDGKFMVPADKIGYVEFSGVEQRRVGFGSL